MRGLFVTGTDTEVGKTFVTAAIARCLRRQGRAVRAAKPVATGAEWIDGRWLGADTRRLAEATGEVDDPGAITPWAFPQPVAPAVAARLNGTALELEALAAAVRRQGSPHGVLLVEGVGGLLCPLTATATVADLAGALGLPLVVVVRNSLGALNHTLLTLEAARHRGLPVAGVVLNQSAVNPDLAAATNGEELIRRIVVPLLAVVPYHAGPATAEVPALAAVDWWRLSGPG
jgi:dethiobiotin synthetase